MSAACEWWTEKQNSYGDPIRAGRQRVRSIISTETRMVFDQAGCSLKKGGGSNTGNQER